MSHIDLNNIVSYVQNVMFYSKSMDTLSLPSIGVGFDGLFRGEAVTSAESRFHIENNISNIGVIATFDDTLYEMCEVELINSQDGVNLDDFNSKVFLINYKETTRFEILDDTSMTNIAIPYEIIFLGNKILTDSSYDIIRIEGSISKLLNDSWFPSILTDAVRSKIVSLSQLFYIRRRDTEKIAVQDSFFYGLVELSIEPRIILETKFIEYIAQLRLMIFTTNSMSIDREYIDRDFAMDPILMNLEDFTTKAFSLVGEYDYDYYSPASLMHIAADMLDDASYTITRQLFSHSIGEYISEEITVVKLLAPDGDYKVLSLDDFISNEIQPSVAIYTDGNLSSFNDTIYSFAEWNDYKFLIDYMSDDFSLRATTAAPVDLMGEVYDHIDLNIYIIEVDKNNVDGYLSPRMTIEAGVDDGKYMNGLYKTMFVYDFGVNPYSSSAWYRPGSSIVKISPWKFVGVSLNGLSGNVKKISDTNYGVIYMSWERRPVTPFKYMVPGIGMPDYYMVRKIDNSDFVIVSLSSSGGSILHMHSRDSAGNYIGNAYISPSETVLLQASNDSDNIADAHMGENAARDVASKRYVRYAKVLYDVMNGVTYSRTIEEDAKRYLKEREESAKFFVTFEYNPYQLNELIVNKDEYAINNLFFEPVPIYIYDGVYFMHKHDVFAPSTEVKVDKVVGNISRVMDSSKYVIATLTDAVKTGKSSLFYSVIEGCSIGTMCSNRIVQGRTPTAYAKTASNIFGFTVKPLIYADANPTDDTVLGVRDLGDWYNKFYYPSVLSNTQGMITPESNILVTIGTYYNELLYEGSMKIGLVDVKGFTSSFAEVSVAVPDVVFGDVYSEFYFILDTSYTTEEFDDYYSGEAEFGMNEGRINLADAYDKVESVWMKMFFPRKADSNYMENVILRLLISSGDFSKNFSLPYYYVDEVASGVRAPGKAGDSYIAEVKYKDIDDQGGEDITRPTDTICGEFRSTTYLQYMGFNHILNYNDGNMIWGNYTPKIKENMNSPYLKILENSVTLPGVTLSESTALSHSISEAILSRIENLDTVYDWKIEEFELTKKDLIAYAYDANSLSILGDAFASSMKFVLTTVGDEVSVYEEDQPEINMFPTYPERKADDGFLDRHEVHQYIATIEKEPDV